ALATVEDVPWEELEAAPLAKSRAEVSPAELYARTQAVLAHFGAEDEERDLREFEIYQRRTSLEGVRRVLALMDRHNQFPRFHRFGERGLEAFADRDGFSQAELNVDFAAAGGYES